MFNKIVIIGGLAGGSTCATRLRRLSEDIEIVILDRNSHLSFSNCALPYHLSGLVENEEDLVLMTEERYRDRFNIDARSRQEVLKIDRANKRLLVKNLDQDKEYYESYNKLILSTGASPILPEIEGLDQIDYFTIRNLEDTVRLKEFIEKDQVKHISVVGAGFIGLEVAENLRKAGLEVSLIEARDQIMPSLDFELAKILEKQLISHGIDLVLSDPILAAEKGAIKLKSSKKIKTDGLVLALGVRPESSLAKKAGLDLDSDGSIQVDNNFQTSDKDIYALGDTIKVYHKLAQRYVRLPLAGPAQKQARKLADHLFSKRVINPGYVGASALKLFDLNSASTGLTENMIEDLGLELDYRTVFLSSLDKPSPMPDASLMHFKLIFEYPSGRILGAQALGKGPATYKIDLISALIRFNASVYDLGDLELSYHPAFSSARDIINTGANMAVNLLESKLEQKTYKQVLQENPDEIQIIDVREKGELESGYLENSKNIPFTGFRTRLDEISKDKPVFLYCQSGQRAYNMSVMLRNLGYDQVYILPGFISYKSGFKK